MRREQKEGRVKEFKEKRKGGQQTVNSSPSREKKGAIGLPVYVLERAPRLSLPGSSLRR